MREKIFAPNKRWIWSYAFVLMLALWDITLSSERKGQTFGQEFIYNVSGTTQSSFDQLASFLSNLKRDYLELLNTKQENIQLEKELKILRAKIKSLEEEEKENIRLKKLMVLEQEYEQTKIWARVIGWDNSANFRVLKINKGRNQGVSENDIVIHYDGLVGHVQRVFSNHSEVLTLLDHYSRVDVILSNSRTLGVSIGMNKINDVELRYISSTQNIQQDEDVFTAGISDLYPKGIYIGKVREVIKKPYQLTQDVILSTGVDFSRLEEVAILHITQETDSLKDSEDE